MSTTSFNQSPPPDLLNAALNGAAQRPGGPSSPSRKAPESAPANPFAALLSGVLQGSQPPAPATADSDAPDTPADGDSNFIQLLALPGSATPSPAPSGGTPDAAVVAGNSRPDGGKSLPVALPGTAAPIPDADTGLTAALAPALDAGQESGLNPGQPPDTRPGATGSPPPRISLADLAFSRQPAGSPLLDVNPDLTAAAGASPVLAGRAINPGKPGGGMTGGSRDSAGVSDARPALPTIASGALRADAVPSANVLDLLRMRLSGADTLPAGDATPGNNPGLATGSPLAAFALGSDGGSGRSGDTASALPANSTLTAGLASGTTLAGQAPGGGLPALQTIGPPGAFAGGLADRLLTLGGPGTHSARLKLHPESLGELDVEIRIDDGRAQVWFGTSTSQARDAIEGSLPRLRELFADQGLQLTRTQVDTGSSQAGQGGFGEQRRTASDGYAPADNRWRSGPGPRQISALPALARSAAPNRLLDVWA
ncbi:MAG: flagellar hook-length control protein FliK [Gammaproteobacteria bacterium]